MRIVAFSCIIGFTIFCGCDGEVTNPGLSSNDTLAFKGYFRTSNFDETHFGEVNLTIAGGSYRCSTDRPYGNGAGLISLEEHIITFTDTLFLLIPALYGPSFVLAGKYHYDFDGQSLWIVKKVNIGQIEYLLEVVE